MPSLCEIEDYYLDEQGRLVFTAAYHLKRGYCCKNGCRHCPYGFQKDSLIGSQSSKGEDNTDS